MEKAYRISGHETFSCRYTWLPKAVRGLRENPRLFSDEARAMVDLGVGKNMVRSIRFWSQVAGVATAGVKGGILNLLNDGDLLPTEESVISALAGVDHAEQKHIRTALEKLHKGKRVLYDRGRARGLSLWPHTSVDLEKAYDDARRAVDTPQRVASLIKDSLESRPVVARRHYIETGNLRHCDVRYYSVTELAGLLEQNPTDAMDSSSCRSAKRQPRGKPRWRSRNTPH